MAFAPHDLNGHQRDGLRVAIVVVVLALVGLLLSALATAGSAAEVGDPRAGLAYAQRVCSECHGVLANQTESPMAKAAPFKVVANTPGMTGTAIAVWLRTPHPTMPNLIVASADMENLVAYILDLRDKK